MRAPMVAANWKMNGSKAICHEFLQHFDADGSLDVVLFPHFLYTSILIEGFAERSISVGVQNVSNVSSGAYTGEISAEMAVDSGATYGLVGHSKAVICLVNPTGELPKNLLRASAPGLLRYCVSANLLS